MLFIKLKTYGDPPGYTVVNVDQIDLIIEHQDPNSNARGFCEIALKGRKYPGFYVKENCDEILKLMGKATETDGVTYEPDQPQKFDEKISDHALCANCGCEYSEHWVGKRYKWELIDQLNCPEFKHWAPSKRRWSQA